MLLIYLKPVIHFGFHLLVPGLIAKKWYSDKWKKAWLILVATMLVDLDHLLSTPIYDPNRLSIGNHILHSYPAIGIYLAMLAFTKTRLIAIGLLLHMFTDAMDYYLWI